MIQLAGEPVVIDNRANRSRRFEGSVRYVEQIQEEGFVTFVTDVSFDPDLNLLARRSRRYDQRAIQWKIIGAGRGRVVHGRIIYSDLFWAGTAQGKTEIGRVCPEVLLQYRQRR